MGDIYGDLKGRPIHAAVDTPATSLSKYLAKALQPLLKHLPAHLYMVLFPSKT